MEEQPSLQNMPFFDEEAWIKLVFLLGDTQDWLDELTRRAVMQVPMKNRKRLLRRSYYLSISALAHILERHYYKIPRHPGTGKFTVPVPEILSLLRDIATEPVAPVPGSLMLRRTLNANRIIGFDRAQIPTTYVTVLTDSGGRIITAFPGFHPLPPADEHP